MLWFQFQSNKRRQRILLHKQQQKRHPLPQKLQGKNSLKQAVKITISGPLLALAFSEQLFLEKDQLVMTSDEARLLSRSF